MALSPFEATANAELNMADIQLYAAAQSIDRALFSLSVEDRQTALARMERARSQILTAEKLVRGMR